MLGKVLFICHPESDYGGGFLYNGLCDVFGDENVYDYPPKPSYHGEVHHYSLSNIPKGLTAPCVWSHSRKWAYTDTGSPHEEVRDHLSNNRFVLCVVESLREVALSNFCGLKDELRSRGIPIVLHDGEDFPELLHVGFRKGQIESKDIDVLLKRELLKDMYPGPDFVHDGARVLGFPFSAASAKILEQVSVPCGQMKYEVSFLAGNTHSTRQEVADALRTSDLNTRVVISPDSKRAGTADGLQSWNEYLRTMAKSHIAASVRGFGLDTVRFWEAPLCTAMLSDCPALHYEFPLVPGLHCAQFSDANDCVSKAKELLQNKELLVTIKETGVEHVLAHHTNVARVLYLVRKLEEMGRL